MKFGVTANPHIPSALEAAKAIIARLEPSHEVLVEVDLAQTLGRRGLPLAHMAVDAILAVGGDGTILRALQLTKAPVLGINSGSLGFLAELDAADVDRYIDRIVRGEHRIEERLRLKVEVNGQRLFDCTNEAVVHTAHVAKMRHFEISVDGSVIQRVRADGIIVATPTGSTSYSMSAGGPIVDPRVDALLITAIAPFKPSMRPYAVPSASQVRVRLVKPRECLLVLDGQHEVALRGTEDTTYTGSDDRARFVRFRDDFYRRIEEKLGGG
jgi:NAD+ kinase